MTIDREWDIVALGETMLRFTPPGMKRAELATSMDVHVGGSESNTMVGLSRLGLRTLWLSRLTDNPLGRTIQRTIAQHGVDTNYVSWTDADRVGLYFLEEGKAPRGSRVLYDRAGSAMSRMLPDQLPQEIFRPTRSRWFHTSGITLAIGENAYATATKAAELAKAASWKVSFDVNYRAKLWSPDVARQKCQSIMEQADIIFIAERDAKLFYEFNSESMYESMQMLSNRFPLATIVVTRGSLGSVAWSNGQMFVQGVYATDAVERLGGGDAFSAGYLYSTIQGEAVPLALQWGAATASLKYSIPGDLPIITKVEVEQVMTQSASSVITR